MSDAQCCADTGELRKVVEEVAEKAAQSAVDKMHLQLKLEFVEMERRISSEVSDTIDDRLEKALGMTPQDHVIQHDRLRRTNDFFGSLQESFWKKILLLILVGALAFFGGYAANFKALKQPAKVEQAITRDEYTFPKPEAPSASNP